MDEDTERLEKMKLRILRSFKWREDIVIPLANKLGITNEECEKIFINHLDMSSLEALHPTYESAREKCLGERLHSDLTLCWLCDVIELISVEEAQRIKMGLIQEILAGKKYDDALNDGKRQILDLLFIK